ncbi:T9SS type A sorting domain-containing protein [Polaribacter gochangensis]|uniref:T9SS type A sorting domain-containing protein n=1 Tax=Polaribacter gochangensis TaxID=3252903 RepID=UPI003904D174
MKKNYLHQLCWCLIFTLFLFFKVNAQSAGDIAFIGFNTDGDDDFSIVVLSDLTNKTIYFSDNETNGTGGFVDTNEGVLTWTTGINTIKAGTIINFNDIDNEANAGFGVSIGTLSRSSGSFSLSSTVKDGIFAYIGTDENTPTTFIAAIQIGTDASELGNYDIDGITLTGTGLVKGASIIIFDDSATPDGAVYNASRSSQLVYSNYYSLISDDANNWTSIVNGDGETLLPFSQEAFTINTTTWTGALSTTWNLVGNWTNGIPTSSSLVSIPNLITSPVISSGTTAIAGNLTIDASEILTINSTNSLTVSGLLTITGDLTINGGGSLIVNGTSTGDLTYNVNVNDTDWHLISSPVVGEQYDDAWNTTNSINVSGAGNNDAVSTYDNTTSVSGSWNYFQTGGAATTFNQGQGYSLKRTGAGSYGFIGTFPNTGSLLTISQGFGAVNKWNFVGNPFPSYIKVSELITANAANLTDSHEFVYVWDNSLNSGAGGYKTLAGTDYIHPGQGFFVNADNSTANNFTISESLQSHQTGITFYKGVSNPTIIVFVNDQDNNQKFTEVKYEDNSTKALDPGFDAGTFTGQSTSFSLYSHLASNSEGIDFMLQSLPKNDYENTIIPLGLNADAGKEITFSINHVRLPTGLMVFLEDTEKKTITRLDEDNSNYKIILEANSNGVGRFFLRTSTTDLRKTLAVNDFDLDKISMYLSSDRTLRVTGLKSDSASLTIYNILGKRVFHKNLKSSSTMDIALSNYIKQGIYIVKLETKKGNINKKIFLN